MKIISKNEIPIGILNEIKFHGLSFSTFLIDFKSADLNSLRNTVEVNKKNDNNLNLYEFGSHKITHKNLNDILNNVKLQKNKSDKEKKLDLNKH